METQEREERPSSYNLRETRGRTYAHRFDHQADFQMLQHAAETLDEQPRNMFQYVYGYVMTQMTATTGIKKHGQPAIDALLAEFAQLDDKKVFKPMDARKLTTQQKCRALRAINLIKEKRSGVLKGRSVADGSAQWNIYTKEQTASPTVSTDALMLTLMIDALEERDVATADVEGAYLHADMDNFTLLKLTGEAVGIMCKVNPINKKFVVMENGRKVLYLPLLKALYGCVRSALLWYELFAKTLAGMGFCVKSI